MSFRAIYVKCDTSFPHLANAPADRKRKWAVWFKGHDFGRFFPNQMAALAFKDELMAQGEQHEFVQQIKEAENELEEHLRDVQFKSVMLAAKFAAQQPK